ncbi:MAG: SPASM domain-containing protein [Pseudomonadota bacterium]|nr:SPASM domain-containing protein [Pseudomonadota bacterium]
MAVINIRDPQRELNTYSQVQHQLPEYPRQVRIETASMCPMACPFCHAFGDFKPLTRAKGRMSKELYTAILDDIAAWPKPPEEIVPTNFGELAMNPHWEWMLHELSRKIPGSRIHLVTTGIWLNQTNLEKLALVPNLKYVNFSVNAFFGETWARVHGQPAKHMPAVVRAVHEFRDRRPDVEVNVSMVQDPDITTDLEKDLFLNYWAPFGPVTVSPASYAGNPKHQPDPPVSLSCRSIIDGLVISDQGVVGTGCCFDGSLELAIGKFPEESLLAIWKGEKLKGLVDLHNSGRRADIPLCRTCTFS